MGFGFKSVKKAVSKAVKTVSKPVVKVTESAVKVAKENPLAIVNPSTALAKASIKTFRDAGGGIGAFVPPELFPTAAGAAIGFAAGGPAGAALGAKVGALQTPQAPGGGQLATGNILGGISNLLRSTSALPGPIGQLSNIGSSFLSGFLPAQGPIGGPPVGGQVPQAIPVMAAAPQLAPLLVGIAGVLQKMSAMVGRNLSLGSAIRIIRRLGNTLGNPALVAAAVGITTSELASLLTANALKGSSGRRMNPGNVKALRRAHRRIKSFHKLCGENDRLRAPRRRSMPRKTVVQCN